ncbi:glycosyltransferase [Flavobacterium phragmitis]|uniref:Glycosyltransferase involved in cell wall bisynthesis n=1 Tax=Flavobacterium phragmitis TaxID=739143 RepID=A0A1I1USC5_9FLAO|nr:glycosyltransferase [Flavobacterium phragmitis]SFD73589.1 Glycosyltransferase involved in cell wall bisynthesis [Flavobacterium phragmitis]
MPKLLQISIEVNSGSVGRIAHQIGDTVLANGWSSFITYARNNNPTNSEVVRIGSGLDVYCSALKTRIFDNDGFNSKNATKSLTKTIEKIKPDIIHLHHLHGYFVNIEILFNYIKKQDIPVVWTFHDCWSFTGHCAYFDFVNCNKWKTECHTCEQKKEYPKSLFIDRSNQNFIKKKKIFTSIKKMTIVSVSKWLDEKVNESFLKDVNTRVIYNGVDLERFYPKNSRDRIDQLYNVEGKYLLLGVASTWDSRKGLLDFIALSKTLDKSFVIILIGLSKTQLKLLPENIIGIERTESQDELCELYSASDLFLNLSVEETFGLTTAEALACGVPTVVYNATACPELITKETGYIIEKGNIVELNKVIEEAKKLGKSYFTNECRKRAVSLFDKNERFMEYYNLYNEILNKNEKQ